MAKENTLTEPRPSVMGRIFWFFLTWPFQVAWRIATAVERRAGIFMTLLAGAVLTLIGFVLSSTFLGIFVGVPLGAAGILLLVRALY